MEIKIVETPVRIVENPIKSAKKWLADRNIIENLSVREQYFSTSKYYYKHYSIVGDKNKAKIVLSVNEFEFKKQVENKTVETDIIIFINKKEIRKQKSCFNKTEDEYVENCANCKYSEMNKFFRYRCTKNNFLLENVTNTVCNDFEANDVHKNKEKCGFRFINNEGE